MKIKIFILFALLVSCSSKENNKEKLIGTWKYQGTEYNKYDKDSVSSTTYIEYTDSSNVYILMGTKNVDKVYTKGYNVDWTFYLVNYDSLSFKYNFIDKNKLEVQLIDSTKRIYLRSLQSIRPSKLFFDLFNKFKEANYMSLDTLGDGTLWCSFSIYETPKATISTYEKQVKYFIDKYTKSLPKEEETNKFDRMFQKLSNIYTWEDLNSKILMECYFNFKDLTDKYTLNDKDKLEVKIWLNVK